MKANHSEKKPLTVQIIKLPRKIPAEWLKDIKENLKESKTKLILTTVLGSSLLTSIITIPSTCYLQKQQTSDSLKEKQAEKKLASYEKLNDEINNLEKSLKGIQLSLQLAPSNDVVAEALPSDIERLVNQKKTFEDSLNDKWIQDNTRQIVGNTFDSLLEKIQPVQENLKLEKNQRNSKVLKELEDLCKELAGKGENRISPIKKHINETMKSIDPYGL